MGYGRRKRGLKSAPKNTILADLTRFNLTSPWWIKELAEHYAHIQMSPFLGSNFYNDTTCTPECLSAGPYACTCGEHPLKTMARALKEINPAMKVQLYQAVDRGDLTPWGSRQIQARPALLRSWVDFKLPPKLE